MIIILLCAGMGKRMGSSLPKPLVQLHGESFVSRIAREASALQDCEGLVIVIQERHQPLFEADLSSLPMPLHFAFQNEPLGTGHALAVAIEWMRVHECVTDRVLCLNGDMPLLSRRVLFLVLDSSTQDNNAVVGFFPPDPTGYGRIYRDTGGTTRIVEEKDCSSEQKTIRLVNAGIYLFSYKDLLNVPVSLTTDNAQNEVYLTDYVHDLQAAGRPVSVLHLSTEYNHELAGVNTKEELERLEHQ